MTRFSIAFAGYEVWPFVQGGGLGRTTWATAQLLAHEAEVTIVTSDSFQREYGRLCAARSPRLPGGVNVEFAPHPMGDVSPFRSWHHAWSASLHERLVGLAPPGGFDLVEFPDYGGQGAVTVQGRRTGDSRLARTLVLVRAHTSHEMTTALDKALDSDQNRLIRALERLSLRFADRLLYPAVAVRSGYSRFYGAGALARPMSLRTHFDARDPREEDRVAPDSAAPFRILYLGRLQRLKGTDNLVRAVQRLRDVELHLTLVGSDTDTGPAGTSLLAHLKRLAGEDPRIVFHDSVPLEETETFIHSHHVVVVPSLWECGNLVVQEALMLNRPVLATPVGGLPELIDPGRSGWLTSDTTAESLADRIAWLVDQRNEVEALIAAGTPRATLDERLDPAAIVHGYDQLAAAGKKRIRPHRVRRTPPVLAVVTSRGHGARVVATVASLERQEWPIQITVVAEHASCLPPAGLLEHLHQIVVLDQLPSRAEAWHTGLAPLTEEYVLLLDAGDILAPGFLARGLEALERDPQLAYVTSFAEGWASTSAPLDNWVLHTAGVDPATGVILARASVLKIGLPANVPAGDEERTLLAELADRRLFGSVIPDRLISVLRSRREWSDSSRNLAHHSPIEAWTDGFPPCQDD